MSLEGKLIEIIGLRDVLEPTPKMLEINPKVRALDVNGCLGWAVEWVKEELRYRVETFDGDHVCISEENLREYSPPSAAAGGFDVAWPAIGLEEYFTEFGEGVLQALVNNYFCVVQMMSVKEQAKSSLTKAYMRAEWSRIIPEFEQDFLGNGSLGKISWLPQDASLEDDALSKADTLLTSLAGVLAPNSPTLGFTSGSRSAGLLRMPFEDEDEEFSLMRGSNDGGLVSGREIEGCLQFTKLKKIGMIYFLHGSGGTLRLNFNDADIAPVEIPIEQGRVLLFRHDLLQFSYKPTGSKSLALQAWMFREERPGECEIVPRASIENWDMSKIPSPPTYSNSNETVDCMSISARSPGGCYQIEDFWQVVCHGADGSVQIPNDRWDNDIYFDPDPHHGNPSKMYSNHYGIVSGGWEYFDAAQFGFSYEEASHLDPVARSSLETVWECLARAGWTAKSVANTYMALGVGGGNADGWQDIFAGSAEFKDKNAMDFQQIARPEALSVANRTSFVLGLRGPSYTLETACSSGLSANGVMHSLMRPRMPGQTKNNFVGQCPYGLCVASNGIVAPFFTMALCSAGMLTHVGRCFTFNSSADGYCRAEGSSAMHYQVSTKEELSRFMILKGSCLNQDGRSASLTAPNGPAQTELTKTSMREAGITNIDAQVQELHGTGTALGDPIEVGALRNCMMKGPDGAVREMPLVSTSSKTNLGHGEALAGLNGLIKSTLMMKFQLGAPNIHLHLLNQNVDLDAYPVLFNDECVETGFVEGYSGVCSFGFSGCNARADIWGMATAGHRQAFPLGYDFGAERHQLLGERQFPHAGIPTVSSSSVGARKLETFDGVFGSGLLNEDAVLSLSGTWDAWTSMDVMEKVPEVKGDAALYQCGFRIGDTMVEEFCIHVDNYADNMIFPASKGAGQNATVLGPGTAPKDYNWRVDGRLDGAQTGAIYIVSLWWYPDSNRKRVTWEMVSGRLEVPWQLHSFTHRYSVKGSWTAWFCQDMESIGEGCYETAFRIGNTGTEEFQFVRDRDDSQLIYPTVSTIDKMSVPVRGPDSNGKGKHWTVMGDTGDVVRLQLTIKDGQIFVTMWPKSGAEKLWKNLPPGVAGSYFLADYDGLCKPMRPSKDNPQVQKASITTRDDEGYHFKILVDKDPNQAIYPELNGASLSGFASVIGPDSFGQDYFWSIPAPEGAKIEVTYDPTQTDSRRKVTWRIVSVKSIEDHTPIGLYCEEEN